MRIPSTISTSATHRDALVCSYICYLLEKIWLWTPLDCRHICRLILSLSCHTHRLSPVRYSDDKRVYLSFITKALSESAASFTSGLIGGCITRSVFGFRWFHAYKGVRLCSVGCTSVLCRILSPL